MNKNLNLVEILKDCQCGTKLYSTVFGEVEFEYIENDSSHPIIVKTSYGCIYGFTTSGELHVIYSGECTLFPSKEQRDWSKFKFKKPKFDPKTLKPFDKVLVRDSYLCSWRCTFYSHIKEDGNPFKYITDNSAYEFCIPYNEETKYLVGTTENAPEYYRYWDD